MSESPSKEMEQLGNYRNGHQRGEERRKRSKAKSPIRIKYISSPMMVQANNASEFRAIVQELTGQNAISTMTTIPDHGTNHYDQGSSCLSAQESPDAKMQNINELMTFLDDQAGVLDQSDEIKFWREFSEGFCASEYPYCYA